MNITVLRPGADPVDVDATVEPGSVVVDSAALDAATGWTLSPEGLCQGEVCVPHPNQGTVELTEAASRLGRRTVLDADAGVLALGVADTDRRTALVDRAAPDFTLPDLDGSPRSLEEWNGEKRLLFAFASW